MTVETAELFLHSDAVAPVCEFTRRKVTAGLLALTAFASPGCSLLERGRNESVRVSSIHVGNRDSVGHTIRIELEADERIIIDERYRVERGRGDVGGELLTEELPAEADEYRLSATLSPETSIDVDLAEESPSDCVDVRIEIFDSERLASNVERSDACE